MADVPWVNTELAGEGYSRAICPGSVPDFVNRFGGQLRTTPSPHVLPVRNGLEMVRVDAITHAAQVIELAVDGNRSMRFTVVPAVGGGQAALVATN